MWGSKTVCIDLYQAFSTSAARLAKRPVKTERPEPGKMYSGNAAEERSFTKSVQLTVWSVLAPRIWQSQAAYPHVFHTAPSNRPYGA